MKVNLKKVKIFKIANRRGYGAICLNNLTEGATVLQTYQRMVKALKRKGFEIDELDSKSAQKLVVSI